jgi:hypothetical protein
VRKFVANACQPTQFRLGTRQNTDEFIGPFQLDRQMVGDECPMPLQVFYQRTVR